VRVVWHDLECGVYTEDLELWRTLARECGDPVLDVGAGTGRVTLDLARRGHRVTALDRDPELLAECERRADGLPVQTVVADARRFALATRFALCLVPMQTIQLLGGATGRAAFLRCARRHLRDGGRVAMAIADTLEPFDSRERGPLPRPDVTERDGVVYSSQPTAICAQPDGFVLARRREVIAPDGSRGTEEDLIHLDRLDATGLEREGAAAGLTPAGRLLVAPTHDYAGSTVVMLGA
jgi:SAM-dependent methyltransferase